MKTIVIITTVLVFSTSVYCQSSILFDSETTIEVTTGADICADVITINGSYFGDGTQCDSPLPVELITFVAAAASSAIGTVIITLNWQTATEVNNYGFEIERTSHIPPFDKGGTEGGWEKVGFVAGHGNSNSTKEYSFVDESVSSGKYSYRLKQIDTDGSFSYSDEIIVETLHATSLPTEYALYQNYPNPFNPSTTIKFGLPKDSKVLLEVYNIIGEKVTTLINKEMSAGYHNINFTATGLATGIYIYRITANEFTSTKKFILMK